MEDRFVRESARMGAPMKPCPSLPLLSAGTTLISVVGKQGKFAGCQEACFTKWNRRRFHPASRAGEWREPSVPM